MKHMILVIAVLAGSAQAQQQPANCLELKKVKIADHVLHQQGQTQAELTLKVKNCSIVEEHAQTTVTFESKPGLDITLDDIAFRRFDDGSVGESSTKVKEVSVSLKLTASPDLPVGESTLHGMLTYQAANGGVGAPETLDFNVPLKVAPPKPYQPPKKPSGFVKGLEIAAEIVVGIPLLLVMMIWCPISGECPDC